MVIQKVHKLKLKNSFSYLLAFTMAAVWICSETTFNGVQITLEIFLILMLIYLSFKPKYDFVEISALFVNILLVITTFFILEITLSLIAAKNIILAWLSYLVLSRYELSRGPIFVLTLFCVLLIVVQVYITDRFPFEIQNYLVTSYWLMESRPLGLFLSEQGSAAFLATAFFGYTFTKRFWFFDIFIMAKTGVATMFLAIIISKVFRWLKFLNRLFESNIIFSFVLFFAIFSGLFLLKEPFLALLYYLDKNSYSSAIIIIDQLFDLEQQINFFQLIPGDIAKFENTLGMPELGYTKYFMEYGAIFFCSLIFVLLKSLKSWRVFLIISIFHFTIIHIPLILYILFSFQPYFEKGHEKV